MSEWQDTEYGRAPSAWRILTLADMSEKITDGAHQSPKPQSIGKYMCSVKDMAYDRFDFSGSKLISDEDYEKLVKQGCQPKDGDILISKDGANCLDLIFVFKQPEELVLLSSIAIVRLLPDYIPDFVRYFLLSPDCQYTMRNNYVSGSAIPRVVLKDFKKVPILTPELKEQKAIAAVLSSLDGKIDLLHRQNKTLEAMAETLFRQWFVEEAKEEWGEKTLGEITEIKAGGDKPKIYSDIKTEECKVPIYSNGIDNEGLYGFTDTAKIFKECITISARGTIGFVCLRQEPFVPIVRLISIVPNEKYLSSKYLYLWAKTQDILGTGTTQEQLTVPDFSRTKIILPPFIKMIEFTNHVNTLFRKEKFNKTQICTLTALRDTLLPKLMSGEVRVAY